MVDHYRIGRWHFDPVEPLLRDGISERRLEDRAARTLELLCLRRGEVVGKQQIIDAVWHGRSVSSNSAAVVVGDLRRALDDDPREPRHIVTVNKRGYRLANEDAQADRALGEPRRSLWSSGRTALALTAALAVLGLSAMVSRTPRRPVEFVVSPVRNDTGAPSLEPLARSLSAVMVDGAAGIGESRVIPRTAARDGDCRFAVSGRLIIWNGQPELAMTTTDVDSGAIVWSSFAAGPMRELARNTTAKLAILGSILGQ